MNQLSSYKQATQTPTAAECFNYPLLKTFKKSDFTRRRPFPWYNFQSLLTDATFQQLYADFPALDFFETHQSIARKYGQRSHDRYYLAYEETIYRNLEREPQKGVIHHEQLPESWQHFIRSLQTDPIYRRFICNLLGVRTFTARYAWHVATAGRSVSPHVDARDKAGTHIFYFNTSEDWRSQWGGATLVLQGKNYPGLNPEISDFSKVEAVEIMNNRSFLFKNKPDAWHAVDTINCPPATYRRIFNVIFELPQQKSFFHGLFGR
ncbi:MAG: 2OG-Fe(II) oxygenase superfamily [Phormidesmis priestleyi Ana]|uniref:2OG-Fe(II) oxygenase superfamily n=1 Tax=Phormidesmis priestleyi Ana TaxID=1666911 RepID=A0A0P8DI80_9CYAN|nr:MAG: 2OG-Fe(II) oxygenase superfamily [Phormidesmis priestleyi Ana]